MMYTRLLLLVLLEVFANATQLENNDDGPIVITRQGAIRGSRDKVSGFIVERFLGIRYGLIPRRFVYSQVNNNSWTGVLNATQYGPICPQAYPKLPMDEDCLSLNIWRPEISSTKAKLLPVLFWVYGSGYQDSSGAENSGDLLAPFGNIIMITLNHRLRSLGYAYGDENEIQGNQGVSDVITALRWVRQNIVFFGGDPSRVTHAGYSGGSAMGSVLPVLTAIDDTLYSRLWLISGVTVAPYLSESTSIGLAKTKLLASKVGCSSVTSGPLTNDTISCLQKINVSTLLKYDTDYDIKKLGGSDFVSFLPVYGTPLIKEPLIQLFKSNLGIRKTTILSTIHHDDEGAIYGNLKPTNISEAYKMAFEHLSFVKKDLTVEQMKPFFEYYFNNIDSYDLKSLKTGLANFITDYTFTCPQLMLSEIYSTYHSVRFGVFNYILDKYGRDARPNGPYHGDATELLFGEPFHRNPYSRRFNTGNFDYSMRDKIQSLRYMKAFADYVHGKEPDNWPELHYNSSNPEGEPIVRFFNVNNTNVKYSKQHICLKWSKLLDFDITD